MKGYHMNGSIQIYYGNGRGKTTASLGLGIRAAGIGKRVIMVQFLKEKHSSTLELLKRLEPEVKIFRFEKASENYEHLSSSEQEEQKVYIRNALNYTNKNGQIDVYMKLQNGDLIFSVADNGNGIPKEDIPNLFKRFSQGTSKKRSTGTGLGLYLSRQIIEAHGGKIWVESKVNKGSEFSFLLTDVVNVPAKAV